MTFRGARNPNSRKGTSDSNHYSNGGYLLCLLWCMDGSRNCPYPMLKFTWQRRSNTLSAPCPTKGIISAQNMFPRCSIKADRCCVVKLRSIRKTTVFTSCGACRPFLFSECKHPDFGFHLCCGQYLTFSRAHELHHCSLSYLLRSRSVYHMRPGRFSSPSDSTTGRVRKLLHNQRRNGFADNLSHVVGPLNPIEQWKLR